MGSTRDGLRMSFGSFSSDDLNNIEPTISLPVKKRSVARVPSPKSPPQVDVNVADSTKTLDSSFSPSNPPPVQHELHQQPIYNPHYEHIPYVPYNHHPHGAYMQPYNPYIHHHPHPHHPHHIPPPMAHMHMMPYGIPQQHVVNPHHPPPHIQHMHHPTPLSASSPSFTPAHLHPNVHSQTIPYSAPSQYDYPHHIPSQPQPQLQPQLQPQPQTQQPQHQLQHPQQAQEEPLSQTNQEPTTEHTENNRHKVAHSESPLGQLQSQESQQLQPEQLQQTPHQTPQVPQAQSEPLPSQQQLQVQPELQSQPQTQNPTKPKGAPYRRKKGKATQQDQKQTPTQPKEQNQPLQPTSPEQPQQTQPQQPPQPHLQTSEPQSNNNNNGNNNNTQSTELGTKSQLTDTTTTKQEQIDAVTNQEADSAVKQTAPKNWASLFASRATSSTTSTPTTTSTTSTTATATTNNNKPPEGLKPKHNGVHLNGNGAAVHPPVDSTLPLSTKILQDLTKLSLSNIPPALQTRGLKNPTNMCFLNVTLQSLIRCPPFAHVLAKLGSVELPQTQMPVTDKFVRLYKEFLPQPRRAVSSTSSPSPASSSSSSSTSSLVITANGAAVISPAKGKGKDKEPSSSSSAPLLPEFFFDLLEPFSDRTGIPYKDGDKVNQQDAQEFLTYILDLMHEEFLSFHKKPEAPKVPEKDDEWEEVGKKNKSSIVLTKETYAQSVISHTFGGKQRSSVRKQSQGAKPSVTIQPFYCLHLDIDKPHIKTLEDALDTYMEPEKLEGYTCDVKGVEVQASKHTSLEALPKVLIIHLKRFAYDASQPRKLDKFIRFPLSLTIKKNFLSTAQVASTEKCNYSLYSVVEHHGKVAVKGHYTCDINVGSAKSTTGPSPSSSSSASSSPSSEWLNFDDHNVTRVNLRDVQNRLAYLLFYVQN